MRHLGVVPWLLLANMASPAAAQSEDRVELEAGNSERSAQKHGHTQSQATTERPCRPASDHEPAVFASPNGNDAWDGSEGRPVASLERALALMSSMNVRTLYLREGTYIVSRPIVLGGDQAGARLLGCAGETPRLLAGQPLPDTLVRLSHTHSITISGLTLEATTPAGAAVMLDHAEGCTVEQNVIVHAGTAILLDHSSRNTLRWNTVRDAAATGIELRDASDENLITGNWINGAGGPETHGGGIFLHGVNSNRIVDNLVENTAGMGIGIANWDRDTINVANHVIGNVVRRVNLTATDSGAIYLLGRSQIDTQSVIADNFIDGSGGPDRHSVGIYLDDSTSGALVSGNVVRNVGSDAVQIHGGSYNLIENNIFDLGLGRPSAVLFQAAPADTNPSNAQVANVVTRNVILSEHPNPKVFVWIEGGQPLIWNNLYYNAVGASMATTAPVADLAAKFATPGFADAHGGDYSFKDQSPLAVLGFRPVQVTRATDIQARRTRRTQ